MKQILIALFLFTACRCNSQTTFLLEATGTVDITPATTGWTSSGSSIIRPMFPTGYKSSSTIATTTIAVANATATDITLFYRGVSPALTAQTISGSVTAYARMAIANVTGATVQSRIKITVVSRAGAIVATLLATTTGASNLTTTLTSYQIANAAALSSYACADGDRIVVEIGIGRSSGTTARNGDISFGSSSGTNITAAGSTTANNPVITFSGNINFYKGLTF